MSRISIGVAVWIRYRAQLCSGLLKLYMTRLVNKLDPTYVEIQLSDGPIKKWLGRSDYGWTEEVEPTNGLWLGQAGYGAGPVFPGQPGPYRTQVWHNSSKLWADPDDIIMRLDEVICIYYVKTTKLELGRHMRCSGL